MRYHGHLSKECPQGSIAADLRRAIGSAFPHRPDAREMAENEEHVNQPEREPHGRDNKKLDREEDQARREEQHDASKQPEVIASARIPSALGIVDPAAERSAVV